MANLTFATVKIATKEDLNNVFIFSLFKKLATEKPFRFVNIILSKNREYVIVNYIPSLDFDIYDLVEEISKKYSCTFSTIGHSYGNMQLTTVEYIVVYKNGEVIFEEEYPYVVFEEEGEMDDEGGYPIDKEATKAIRNKLEADKKEWFPTLYQKSEHLNSDGENIVWRPSSEEVAEEPSEKLTEKEKCLLASMFEYLRLIGFVDVDGEEEHELDEDELEAKTAQKIQVIQDKILGKDYSSND
jgi:hypothetical protein